MKDIEELQIDPELMRHVLKAQTALAPERKRKRWWRACTVVPRAWEVRLLQAEQIGTYRLALELLYRWWQAEQNPYGGGQPITVSNEVAKAVNLSPKSRQRALAELERLELIKATQDAGKAPRVVLRRLSQRR